MSKGENERGWRLQGMEQGREEEGVREAGGSEGGEGV